MSGQIRSKNGRFVKQKVLEQKRKSLEAMVAAKKKKKDDENMRDSTVCDGNRVVNMNELAANLNCCNCKTVLSLKNIIHKTREGLHSILRVVCSACSVVNIVHTGKKVESNSHLYSDVNLSAVLGAISSGSGCTGLNTILNCLDVPKISMKLYKRYEREVGPSIEKVAKESCKKAANEEKLLVIEHVEKLCENL